MTEDAAIAGVSLEQLLAGTAGGSAGPGGSARSAGEVGPDDVRERILAAALAQVEDFGIRRFTVDEVARRSGVSRVTVYRYFPKKDRLLEAVLMHELQRVVEAIDAIVSRHDRLDDRLVEGFAFGLTFIREHQLLQRLLRTEPELVLPALTVDAAPLLTVAREFIPRLARENVAPDQPWLDDEQLAQFGELLGRAAISFLLTPESVLTLGSADEIRDFARRFLAPLLAMVASGGPQL